MKRKVQAGGLAGALTVIVVWGIGAAGLEVPPEVASAFTTLLSFGVALAVPDASTEQ